MNKKNIDIFVSIIDNFGDIGFVLETILYFKKNFSNDYNFVIWTNDDIKLKKIFDLNNVGDFVKIKNVEDCRSCGEVAISFLHSDFPRNKYKLVLRVDYLSLDDEWLKNNQNFHISSTSDNKIIELIPSPKKSGSGLLPKIFETNSVDFYKNFLSEILPDFDKNKKIFSMFVYNDTLKKMDFDKIPENIEVLIFGAKLETKFKNVHFMPFLDLKKFYNILNVSDYLITRGEASFMQVIQMGKPFFWDIYHDIGGFPDDQSRDFLDLIGAGKNFEKLQNIIWHKDNIDVYDLILELENSKNVFKSGKYKNLAEEIKNFLDKN